MVDLLRMDQQSKAFFRRLGKEEREQRQGRVRKTARRMRRAVLRRLPRPSVHFLRKEARRADDTAEQIWNELERSDTGVPIVEGKLRLDKQTFDAAKAQAEADVRRLVQDERQRLAIERKSRRKGRGKSGGGTRRRRTRSHARRQGRRQRSRRHC